MALSLKPFVGYGPEAPHRLVEQEFGMAFTPGETYTVYPMATREYYRPWRQVAVATRDIGSTIGTNKDRFHVSLDVQHFAPEDISVRTTDGFVIVEGHHEEKKDEHGLISRHFTRRYALPANCDPNSVESKLSSDGVLTLTAPRLPPQAKYERVIPISQTGPLRKEIQDGTAQQTSQTEGDANGTDNL